MNRDLSNSVWFLLGVVLAAFVVPAFASFPPSTMWRSTSVNTSNYYPSATEAAEHGCRAMYPLDGSGYQYPPGSGVTLNPAQPVTTATAQCYGYHVNYPGTYQWLSGPSLEASSQCPTGSTLSGGVCSCTAPLVENAGACVEPNNCPDAGTNHNAGMYDLGASDSATPPTTACVGGCELSYSGSGIVARQLVNGVYHYFAEGSYDHTGQTCSSGGSPPTATPDLPPPDCDSQTQDAGTVNGRFVCLDRTTTTTTTTTAPVTNPDGSTTETTTTTDTKTGEQTTTTTTTAPDGTQTSTTTTSPIPGTESTFCQNNPDDPTCKKDDIPWGEIPSMGLIPVHKVEVETAYDVMGGEGMCPADETVDFMGQTLTWSYGPICTFAEAVRPLVIGLAWLSFGLIIVGAFGRK